LNKNYIGLFCKEKISAKSFFQAMVPSCPMGKESYVMLFGIKLVMSRCRICRDGLVRILNP